MCAVLCDVRAASRALLYSTVHGTATDCICCSCRSVCWLLYSCTTGRAVSSFVSTLVQMCSTFHYRIFESSSTEKPDRSIIHMQSTCTQPRTAQNVDPLTNVRSIWLQHSVLTTLFIIFTRTLSKPWIRRRRSFWRLRTCRRPRALPR